MLRLTKDWSPKAQTDQITGNKDISIVAEHWGESTWQEVMGLTTASTTASPSAMLRCLV